MQCTLVLGVLCGIQSSVPPAVEAKIGTIDAVPAATLLLPHFAVDLDDSNNATTRFSIRNAAAEPALVHVTFWSDWSVPTIDFDVFLTGYDVFSMDLAQLFIDGSLPPTAHNDLGISPVGWFSLMTEPATGIGPGATSCDSILPLPRVPQLLLAHIRAAHTGQPSPVNGLCSGSDLGDNVARGYITFDSVSACSVLTPADSGYFLNGGNGVANNRNVLLGEYSQVQVNSASGYGETMVHIEASSTDPRTQPGQYTFWARYSLGADNREPLATSFWARYAASGFFSETTLNVWRDSKTPVQSARSCSSPPSWYPLFQAQIVIFDESENASVASLLPFPSESSSVAVGSASFPVPFAFGWIYFNLNSVVGGATPLDALTGPTMQNWITIGFSGLFVGGHDAFQLDNASEPSDVNLPICDGPPDPASCP